jgi:hypothetical protein
MTIVNYVYYIIYFKSLNNAYDMASRSSQSGIS